MRSLPFSSAEPHAQGLVRRHQRHALERVQERQPRHDERALVVLGDDLVVGRELPVDQLHRDADVVRLEHEVAVVDADRRRRLARLDRAPQLDDALARDQHARRQLRPARQRPRPPSTAGGRRSRPCAPSRRPTRTARRPGAGASRPATPRRWSWRSCRAAPPSRPSNVSRLLDRGQLRVVAVGHADDLELDLAGRISAQFCSVRRTRTSSSGSPFTIS